MPPAAALRFCLRNESPGARRSAEVRADVPVKRADRRPALEAPDDEARERASAEAFTTAREQLDSAGGRFGSLGTRSEERLVPEAHHGGLTESRYCKPKILFLTELAKRFRA